jgi:predicted AlkP superfamily pyrophosphatase or phosphodiesterase
MTKHDYALSEASGMSSSLVKPAANGRGLSVFVLIDALGWKYLEGREFLSDLLPYRRPLRTVLGFSSGAIPSILTGQPPSKHGHWNLFYYDPKGSPFQWIRYLRFLPNRILDSRIFRKLVKELGRHFLGMGPQFECCVSPRFMPYFNWLEKRNIYDRGGIMGAPSIFDQLARSQVPHRVYTYHEATDTEIFDQAERDIRAGDTKFFFVYLSEMDMFLHMNCNEPQRIRERLEWYEKGLRRLFKAAREIDPRATLVITSDHGMTPVRKEFDVLAEMASLRLRIPEDYLVVYDSTMARFWFFNDGAREKITSALRKLPCGRVLLDSELRDLGVLFEDRRYGEIVFLLHAGWMISRSDFNGPGWVPSGMHGYDPADAYSDAVYLSDREPAFELTSVQDVYRCMWTAACEGQ